MLTMLGRSLGLVLLVATLVPAAPLDRLSHSATIATQLAKALSEQRLDAIAAQDPDEPDRFIAALFFEDTQLLVVSARYASPSLLKARLAQKQYRDVYLDLSSASIADSSILFQDMNADGLCARRDQAADIVYDGSQTATDLRRRLGQTQIGPDLRAAVRGGGPTVQPFAEYPACTAAGSKLINGVRAGPSAVAFGHLETENIQSIVERLRECARFDQGEPRLPGCTHHSRSAGGDLQPITHRVCDRRGIATTFCGVNVSVRSIAARRGGSVAITPRLAARNRTGARRRSS